MWGPCKGLQIGNMPSMGQTAPDMGLISTILRRLKLDATEAAIVAIVLLAVVNALVEFWRALSIPP